MPEICLKQPGFSYSASGPFTKNKERVETYIQTANTDHICRDDPDKACVQYDMAYGKYIDLTKRTQSDKFLKDKGLKLLPIQNMMDIKEDYLQWFTSFLTKNLLAVM